MATVFRARDRELRRDVAVKVLFPHLCRNREVVSRFQREARAAAALDHPHILRVFDVGGASAPDGDGDGPVDPPYIVLELVRGPSLEPVARDAVPPLGEVVAAFGVALCGALAHAHRAGVIHRDVKPANVLVADGGRLVLGDFGVARVLDDESSVVTRTGALLGTPAFMSPEQATGSELDARSDLYSLGATLYQMATGSLPVAGSAARAVAQILAGEVVPPLRRNPGIGVDLARVIERLMRVEPDDRFADAGAAEEALRAVAQRAGEEPDELLRGYFADPAGCQARLLPVVVAASMAEARAALAGGQRVRALALADRALALDASCRDALDFVERIGRGRARRRAAVAAVAVAAAAAGTWAAMTFGPASRGAAARVGQGTPGDVASAAGAAPAGVASGPATGAAAAAAPELPPARQTRAGSEAASGKATAAAGSQDGREAGSQDGSEAGSQDGSEAGSQVGSGSAARTAAGSTTDAAHDAAGAAPHAAGTAPHAAAGGAVDATDAANRSTTSRPTATIARARHRRDSDREVAARGRFDAGATAEATRPDPIAPPSAAAPAPSPAPSPATPRPARAVLTLEMDSWCDVYVDDAKIRTANPKLTFEVEPGTHLISCAREGQDPLRWSRRVTLAPGERRVERGHILPAATVTVRLSRGDAVRIKPGNRILRSGARAGLPAGRVKVEVLRGGRTIASDWVTFRPGAPCTLQDSPAIDCE